MSAKVIAVVSGGLDSTTLVYDLVSSDYDVDCISFNYNQRHKKELEYARATAKKLGLRHDVVDISSITGFLQASGSSLITPGHAVPEGHYAADNMRSTVVPNRNMIMCAIAGGIAVARGAIAIATAVHAGDHDVYPDCRPKFFAPFKWAMYRANEGFGNLQGIPQGVEVGPAEGPIWTPYIYMSKTDIAETALTLEVPLEETWSCYKGGEKHCGKCGTCVERLEAINGAIDRHMDFNKKTYDTYAIPEDKTEYENGTYWKEALTRG
jgi:7-cyano-7-deazaguanine synthase